MSKTVNENHQTRRKPGQKPEELIESSLSRVWQAAQDYDIAIITAWRYQMVDCLNRHECTGQVLTRGAKDARNRKLAFALKEADYGITAVDGSWIEGFGDPSAKEVTENSFLVVNLPKDKNFEENIVKLGQHFCQDSVFIKHQGKAAVLIGTNASTLGTEKMLPAFSAGNRTGPTASKIRGRPFIWSEKKDSNVGGKLMIQLEGREVLKAAGILPR